MSITPPSDLVLDVAQAIEPSQYRVSVAKFQPSRAVKSTIASNHKVEFDQFAQATQIDSMHPPVAMQAATAKPHEAYRKFESLMLQNFINAMFVDESPTVFGKGAGAEYWKSMMVDAMADKMSQAGGIGLADMVEGRAASPNSAQNSASHHVATSSSILVHQSQRDFIRHLNKSV